MNTCACTYNKGLCCLFLLLLVISLVGFVSKVNENNFEKIEAGMTLQQVINILGKPSHLEAIIANNDALTLAIWRQPNSLIMLKFIANRVAMKNFSKNIGVNTLIGDDDFITKNDHEDVENRVREYVERSEKKRTSIATLLK